MISFSYICAHCCDICVDSPLLWPGILLLCCLIVLSIVLQMASVTCDYETFAVSYLCLYKKMIYFYLLSHQEFLLDNYLNMHHLLISHSFMTLQKKKPWIWDKQVFAVCDKLPFFSQEKDKLQKSCGSTLWHPASRRWRAFSSQKKDSIPSMSG